MITLSFFMTDHSITCWKKYQCDKNDMQLTLEWLSVKSKCTPFSICVSSCPWGIWNRYIDKTTMRHAWNKYNRIVLSIIFTRVKSNNHPWSDENDDYLTIIQAHLWLWLTRPLIIGQRMSFLNFRVHFMRTIICLENMDSVIYSNPTYFLLPMSFISFLSTVASSHLHLTITSMTIRAMIIFESYERDDIALVSINKLAIFKKENQLAWFEINTCQQMQLRDRKSVV